MKLEELRRVVSAAHCPWCLRRHAGGVVRRRRCSACCKLTTPPWLDPRDAHLRAGYCFSCRAQRVPRLGAWRCVECADFNRAKQRATRDSLHERGLCDRCGREPHLEDMRLCLGCKARRVA